MSSFLEKIIVYKREELLSLRRKFTLKDVQLKAQDQEPPRPFLNGFNNSEIHIIAEIKKASPSAGLICKDFKPLDIAHRYEEGGARAISVLTDTHFFQGSLDILSQVKKTVGLPCLRKDFTLHEYHIFEARAAGADAILLIAAVLDDAQLKDFQQLTSALGMKALVEVHEPKEFERVMAITPDLIGVNNRNLNTFKVDLKTSLDLIPKIPDGLYAIAESGIETHADLKRLKEAGFDGFLIGETLMRSANPVDTLKKLRGVY